MSTGNELVTLKQADNYYKDLRKRSAPVIFNNVVGNPVVFSDAADGLPIQSLKVHLLPRQEGSGDPSPENIRSIIPWNGLTVLSFAENLLNINSTGKTQSGMSYTTVEKGGKRVAVRVSGETTDNNSFFNLNYVSAETLSILPGNYKAYGYTEKVGFRVYYINANGVPINALITDVPEPVNTFTIPTDAKCSWMRLQAAPNVQIDELIYPILISADDPNTETDISFPSPVYGGEHEAVSGKLMLEFVPVDLSTMGFTYRSGWNCWVANADSRFETVVSNDTPTRALTAEAKAVAASNYTSSHPANTFAQNTGGAWFFDNGSTENPPSGILIVPLATPQEVQLTTTQLQSLLGNNTIWSDANGDIEVEYRADTGLFLKQNTVKDVQLNGTSILENLIANIPLMSWDKLGVAKVSNNYGLTMGSTGGQFLQVDGASQSTVKAGGNSFAPITPSHQHEAAFYGLTKVAGVDMAQSLNPVGTYTPEAQQAIRQMLGLPKYVNYEKLVDYTTSEEAEVLSINTDMNGLPFKIRAARVIVIIPNTTTGNASWFYAYMHGKLSNNTTSLYQLPTLQCASSGSHFYYDAECDGLTPRTTYGWKTGTGFKRSGEAIIGMFPNDVFLEMSGFKLEKYSGDYSNIPSGTRVILYGIRM